MKEKRRNTLAWALAALIVIVMCAMPGANAFAAEAKRETVQINQSVSYTGTKKPGYTFESSQLSTKEQVGAMVFNISIDLPAEGEPGWNDWCGEAAAVKAGDNTAYYDFGGAQVGWGVDMTGDDKPDTTGVGTASWVGTAANGTCTVVVPINAAEFAVDFYDNCWDKAADIPHLKVNNAIAMFGTAEEIVQEAVAAAAEEQESTKEIPAFDPNGTYHAYLGVQSESFIFRNPWADSSLGANGSDWEKHDIGNNFNGLTGWDGPEAVAYPAKFTDCEIKGNGIYQVSLTDFDFGNDSLFNTLFISTDIPLKGGSLKFTNVKVIMDGSTEYTFDQGVIPGIDTDEDKDYYEVQCINIWNNEQLGGKEGLFSYAMPSKSIVLEFAVSGFAYDKAEETSEKAETAGTTEAVPASAKPADEGGANTALVVAAIVIVCAAVAAAIIFVVRKKSKKQ